MFKIKKKQYVLAQLNDWDKCSLKARITIMNNFIEKYYGCSRYEIEENFCGGASLFLTRIVAWMKIVYTNGIPLNQIFSVLQIFIKASYKYLDEFVQVGGILNLIEILGVKQLDNEIKEKNLSLMLLISNQGVQYKEFICECYGVQSICECIVKSEIKILFEKGRRLLINLFEGNFNYQNLIFKCHISLLSSKSTNVQYLALINLKYYQRIIGVCDGKILKPLFFLLKSLHVEIQYEVIEFLKILLNYDNIKDEIICGLVNLLNIENQELLMNDEIFHDVEVEKFKLPFDIYIQQSSALKCIRYLIVHDKKLTESFLKHNILKNVFSALINFDYLKSQRQAAYTIKTLHEASVQVVKDASSLITEDLYFKIINDIDRCYTKFTENDIMLLKRIL